MCKRGSWDLEGVNCEMKETSKRTISTSSGFKSFQMISEPDIERCDNKDADSQTDRDCKIPHRNFSLSHIDEPDK